MNCVTKAQRQLAWQRANREHVNAKQREYYRTEKGQEIRRRNNLKAKSKKALYTKTDHAKALNRASKRRQYQRRRSVILSRVKAWQNTNREQRRAYLSQPHLRLHGNVSRAIRAAIRLNKAGRGWESLVGYTRAELVEHLESQFRDGMSWANYGQWEIDHIRPRAAFAFATAEDEQFKACWALTNLQPLWMAENRSKSAKVAA